MAVSKPDFTRQFGSAKTDLTPISNSNYLQGWDFVGSTPPTKNDFTYLQNLADQRTIWLYENYNNGRLLNVRVFASTGTYTPTAGTNSIIIEAVGGGGGGGGSASTTSAQSSIGGSGGSGGYIKVRYNTVPSSASISVGVSGVGGGAAAAGGAGGSTTITGGSVSVTARGGTGGVSPVTASTFFIVEGQAAGVSTSTGTVLCYSSGQWSAIGVSVAANTGRSGTGGGSYFGTGANGVVGGPGLSPFSGYGGGGSGGVSLSGSVGYAGGAGAAGLVVIWEYA